ncbi:HNH endonuclease family protein [Nostoc sp.]|uniref:HNH endonuclease family protein n=1 Tax=Nostoc sp. TaxID=1180 RepID=UPI002FF4AECB
MKATQKSLQTALAGKKSYKRFPGDEEFRRELVVKDIYNFRGCNYLLRKLENYERKELVNVPKYTIEHIMPQNPNLSLEWQADLGEQWKEIRAKYLHTIGNLTLTGYNPELSDRSFIEKRDIN